MYANFHCSTWYGPVRGTFIHRLPEGICCCLQTCSVSVVLLVMCCICVLVFIVTSADMSQLWVYTVGIRKTFPIWFLLFSVCRSLCVGVSFRFVPLRCVLLVAFGIDHVLDTLFSLIVHSVALHIIIATISLL